MRSQRRGRSRRFLLWNSSSALGIRGTSPTSDAFLSAYVIVPVRDSTGKRAYELLKLYAKPHGLHVFDSLVAATAIEEGLTLVTKNRRHLASSRACAWRFLGTHSFVQTIGQFTNTVRPGRALDVGRVVSRRSPSPMAARRLWYKLH